ncbi:GH3 auxin-responsive promoter-domain-containing protein [Pisolithus albus]|nr:GH3 auxin-responsive promoter-domain-containing protein [Pisolithus albus]
MDDLPPTPITSLTPELVQRLREQAMDVLSYLVKTNSATTYFQESDVLPQFRAALHLTHDGHTGIMDYSPKELFDIYHNNVGLSVYKDYLPTIARFFEQPCNKSSVENLMAPGLPVFIAHSSGTSGGASKYFPKYRHPEHMSRAMAETLRLANPPSKNAGKNCIVFSLACRQVVTPLDEDGDIAKHIPVCLLTSGMGRIENKLPVEEDASTAALKIPNYSSPIAVSFIANYKSFLFMHALFALLEPKVETINTVFTTSCRDLCRTIDDHWEDLVQCIETGVIPDIDGIEHVKDNLQVRLCVYSSGAIMLRFLQSSPERAEELRRIEKSTGTTGWFKRVWPQLRAILANASGPFSTVIPEIRHYIGPDVSIQSVAIASSEAYLAIAYDPRDLNLYKVIGSDDVVEFLPVNQPEESKYLAQAWNVESGRKYEVVLTTRDGFWRYRLGDVVEIAGFDPCDGQPLIRYIEARFHLLHDESGCSGDPGANISAAPAALHDHLQKNNENYLKDSRVGKIGVPCVRVVRPGTFGDYREWKVRTKGGASGQVKVPIVIWSETDREWLEARVAYDI